MPEGADNAITSAAGYLARNGPVSSQDVDRWEENAGASPFTIGLEIVAMLVAATRLTGPDRTLARALADNWNERLEEFTFVSGDEIDQAFGTDGHYVRIGLPGGGRVERAQSAAGYPARRRRGPGGPGVRLPAAARPARPGRQAGHRHAGHRRGDARRRHPERACLPSL